MLTNEPYCKVLPNIFICLPKMNKSLTGFDHDDRIFGRTNPLK